jgi:hypothetical protein
VKEFIVLKSVEDRSPLNYKLSKRRIVVGFSLGASDAGGKVGGLTG